MAGRCNKALVNMLVRAFGTGRMSAKDPGATSSGKAKAPASGKTQAPKQPAGGQNEKPADKKVTPAAGTGKGKK